MDHFGAARKTDLSLYNMTLILSTLRACQFGSYNTDLNNTMGRVLLYAGALYFTFVRIEETGNEAVNVIESRVYLLSD